MYVLETTVVLAEDSLSHWKIPLSFKNKDLIGQSPISLVTDSTPYLASFPSNTDSSVYPLKSIPSPTPTSNGGIGQSTNIKSNDAYSSSPTTNAPSQKTALVNPEGNGNRHRKSNDKQTTKVILGSILGGVLGFAIFAIVIFCLLNYFGGRLNRTKKKQARKMDILPLSSPSNDRSRIYNNSNSWSIQRDSNSYQDYGESHGSSLIIPVNEEVLPYDASPFESQEILKFNPTDPHNMFSKHEKLPSGLRNLAQPCAVSQIQEGRGEVLSRSIPSNNSQWPSPAFEKHLQVSNNSDIIAKHHSASQSSSIYSSSSLFSDKEEAESINKPRVSDPFTVHVNGYPCVVEKAHQSTSRCHSNDICKNSTPLARNVINGYDNGPARQTSLIHDDGCGDYSDLYFDEQLLDNSIETPQIPPAPSLWRRHETLKKIREYGNRIKRHSKTTLAERVTSPFQESRKHEPVHRTNSINLSTQNVFNDYTLYSRAIIYGNDDSNCFDTSSNG